MAKATSSRLNGLAPAAEAPAEKSAERIVITAPKIRVLTIPIVGTAPLVINAMPHGVVESIKKTQEAGQQAAGKKKREPKNFEACYKAAMHVSTEGWHGIHASAFRCAMIDVCRTVGFHMTKAKMSIFIVADGYTKEGKPLVKITHGEPEMSVLDVRLPSSGVVDIRARPMWREWKASPKVKFDLDQFSATDVVNLMARAGLHCGVGEGRPFSKDSAGCGFGTFELDGVDDLFIDG